MEIAVMKNLLLPTLMLSLLVAPEMGLAQAPPDMPEPTKEHAWLAQFVGEWKTESKATMGPEQPPMECSATLVSRQLGGFWVMNEMKGDMAGTPMTAIQTIGYDAAKKKYVGTWVDSMTSFMWQYEGSVDATGKILTLRADGPNFAGDGSLTQFEDIYEFKSDKQIILTSRMKVKQDEWLTFMSGTATRLK
jgi:hypothetical protein